MTTADGFRHCFRHRLVLFQGLDIVELTFEIDLQGESGGADGSCSDAACCLRVVIGYAARSLN